MKIISICITIGMAGIYYQVNESNYQPFLFGVACTFVMQLMFMILIIQIRMRRQIQRSKLSITFEEIKNTVDYYTDFQNIIPDSSDRIQDSISEFSAYEPSVRDDISEANSITKTRFQQQAGLYLNQIKNYFECYKLPLQKFNRKVMLQHLQQLTNFNEMLINYYSNLEKAFQPLGQVSLLSKISYKDITTQKSIIDVVDNQESHSMSQMDEIHCELLCNLYNFRTITSIKLPKWQQIRQQIKGINNVFIQQKNFLTKSAQPLIQQHQKTYLEAYKNIKKLKTTIQTKYGEVYKTYQKHYGEDQLLEKDIEFQSQQFSDLKKSKGDPQKLIRMEMNIKLLEQKKSTVNNKLSASKYTLKEVEDEAAEIDIKLANFKENWDCQFQVLLQSLIRSLLQIHYENYYAYLLTYKPLIQIVEPHPTIHQQTDSQPLRRNRTISMNESDPVRLMRKEKDDMQELMARFSKYDDNFQQMEKYDQECLGIISEVSEALRKCSTEVSIYQFTDFTESKWVMDSVITEEGISKNQIFYENALLSCGNIETRFLEMKSRIQKEYKEMMQSVKDRLNNITYVFNCMLKETEKFNLQNNKGMNSFTDYQKQKDIFNETFAKYKSETEEITTKLHHYEKKYQHYIEYHQGQIALTKFQVMMVGIELCREIVRHTFKLMDKFDENYQKQNEHVKQLVRRKSNIYVSQSQFFNNVETQSISQIMPQTIEIPKSPSKNNSTKKSNTKTVLDTSQDKQQQNTVLKEKYIFESLVRVLFLQWTKSLCFREKFMTELYQSLNTNRPKALDEIYVTNIDIGGDPPEILQLIPQKSDISCVFDLELAFRGYFTMVLETNITISLMKKSYPLTVKIKVTSINGRLRLCYTPSHLGKSWFAFVGEPIMNIAIEPTISNYNISEMLSISNDILREFVIYKIKMLTFPNKEQISVPLADYEKEIPQFALDQIRQFVDKLKMNGNNN